MTNSYDFDKVDQEDKPLIIMGGHKYRLRYPTVEDIEAVQKMKTDEERTNALYTFIEPEEGSPKFKEVIRKQNIKVFKAFSEMIKTEFGVEG